MTLGSQRPRSNNSDQIHAALATPPNKLIGASHPRTARRDLDLRQTTLSYTQPTASARS